MAETAKTTAFRFPGGVVIRVDGSGTMLESRVLNALGEQVLAHPASRLVVDLEGSSYLDSTFMGGLVGLYKRHGIRESRFAIRLGESRRAGLFGVSGLAHLLPFVSELPPIDPATAVALQVESGATREEVARHVIECHRRLAELGGSEAPAFQGVADALEGELGLRARRRS